MACVKGRKQPVLKFIRWLHIVREFQTFRMISVFSPIHWTTAWSILTRVRFCAFLWYCAFCFLFGSYSAHLRWYEVILIQLRLFVVVEITRCNGWSLYQKGRVPSTSIPVEVSLWNWNGVTTAVGFQHLWLVAEFIWTGKYHIIILYRRMGGRTAGVSIYCHCYRCGVTARPTATVNNIRRCLR